MTSQNTETNKQGWPLPEKLCPRCYFAEAKIDGDIGICSKCGPIRKVHYEMKSIRQGKTLTGDYWKLATKRPARPKPDPNAKRVCTRCGSEASLERDHIKPKSEGGSNEDENLRDYCKACHDYRHARDAILKTINNFRGGNGAQLTMWLFRLGVLEALNTPEQIRERGYKSYWELPETHYSRWYESIKTARGLLKDQKMLGEAEQKVLV